MKRTDIKHLNPKYSESLYKLPNHILDKLVITSKYGSPPTMSINNNGIYSKPETTELLAIFQELDYHLYSEWLRYRESLHNIAVIHSEELLQGS